MKFCVTKDTIWLKEFHKYIYNSKTHQIFLKHVVSECSCFVYDLWKCRMIYRIFFNHWITYIFFCYKTYGTLISVMEQIAVRNDNWLFFLMKFWHVNGFIRHSVQLHITGTESSSYIHWFIPVSVFKLEKLGSILGTAVDIFHSSDFCLRVRDLSGCTTCLSEPPSFCIRYAWWKLFYCFVHFYEDYPIC